MEYLIYSPIEMEKQDFIAFWAQKHFYSLEYLYEENIGQTLNRERVIKLFTWKNGGNIATKKIRSIEDNYLPSLIEIPVLNNIENGRIYLESLGGGVIWNIFWLHCLKPQLFPIFDQHTYRAYKFITESRIAETAELKDNEKIELYLKNYIHFFSQLGSNENRKVDKALFMYGRFLKNWDLINRI